MTGSFWLAASGAKNLAVRHVSVDGVDTRVIEAGEPAAPPLVCLHGTGGHAEAFVYNLAALADRHHVLAYDLPAHGWSSAPERSYEIDGYCRHLHAFLDAFALPQATLIGQSLGGWIAAAYAAGHPGRVTRLVLVGAGGNTFDPAVMERLRVTSMAAVQTPTEELIRARVSLLFSRPGAVGQELVACLAGHLLPPRCGRCHAQGPGPADAGDPAAQPVLPLGPDQPAPHWPSGAGTTMSSRCLRVSRSPPPCPAPGSSSWTTAGTGHSLSSPTISTTRSCPSWRRALARSWAGAPDAGRAGRPARCRDRAEIVGGGLAGLAVAVSLARRGWTVRVHERAAELREIGAGLKENGLRALDDMGVSAAALARAVPLDQMDVVDSTSGRTLTRDVQGVRVYAVLRTDLHRAIASAAAEAGVRWRPSPSGWMPRREAG